jgi:serine phosphatase RsbU (regulator of sigma subunit)
MARVRFTLRAYLAEGHPPDRCLELCARQVDIVEDGHMVTALVGFADTRTREVTLANAGHPNPLVIADGGLQFASTEAGPPLGVAVGPYPTATLQMPTGSTLLAFTDGLVERRDEDIDVGLGRLAQTAGVEPAAGPLEELVTAVLTAMVGSDAEDDVAVLAFRWEGIETQGEVPAKRTAVGA